LHDTFFAEPGRLSRDDLDADARALHLNMGRWGKALDSDAPVAALDADRAAADAFGFKGTPTFLIAAKGSKSAYVLVGAQSYSKFRRLIERSLAETVR
ncbi:MAG: DsbA family protein, partial [Polyangiaceae bacterium]